MKNKKTILILLLIVLILIIFCISLFINKFMTKVVFNTDGGTKVTTQFIIKGNTAKKPSNPIKEGYIFVGWQYNDMEFDFSTEIEEEIILTATWLKNDLNMLNCENQFDNIQTNNTKLNMVSCNGYKGLVNKTNNNIILISRPTCSFCNKYIPIIEEIVKEYNISINYFNIDTLTENEIMQFYNSNPLFLSESFGTPTLIITNNNKMKAYFIAYRQKYEVINWLNENGIIK